MGQLTGHGVSVAVPPGWEGRIYRRPEHGDATATESAGPPAAPGATTHPVVHLSTIPLPPETADFASNVVDDLGADDALIVLFEHHPTGIGSPLFALQGMPRALDPDAFDPDALQRSLRGQAGFQVFFTEKGRPYCLYVVVGSYRNRHSVVPTVNAVLEAITIEARSARDPTAPVATTIRDVVAGDPELSVLTDLIVRAGFDETLAGPGPLTLFAPLDAAFERRGDLEDLRSDGARALSLLMYHAVRESLAATELQAGRRGATVLGPDLVVDPATIVRADVAADNGRVHVMDTVLEVPEP